MNNDEVRQIITSLKQCEPGNLPPELFLEIARLTPLIAIEFVPLRKCNDVVEVLLIPRPEEDTLWPGKLHTPGTILRATDSGFEDAFERLFAEELQITDTRPTPQFTGYSYTHDKRSASVLFEYVLPLNDSHIGTFYDCNNLPDNFISEQAEILRRAVAHFTQMP